MVLKRKLPSKLTQPNPTAKKDVENPASAPLQTDFSAPDTPAPKQQEKGPAAPFSDEPAVAEPAASSPTPAETSFMMDVPEEDLMPTPVGSAEPSAPVPAPDFPEAASQTTADPFAPAAPVATPEPAQKGEQKSEPELQPQPAPAEPPVVEVAPEPVAEVEAAPAVPSPAPEAPAMEAPQAPPPPSFSAPQAPKSGALKRKKKKGKKAFGEQQPKAAPQQETANTLIDAVKEETEEEEILPNMEGESYINAPTHFDGSDRVETSLKEIRGEFVDPSTQETEAAYISAPAERGYDSPRMALPDLPLPGTENQPMPKPEPVAEKSEEKPAEPAPAAKPSNKALEDELAEQLKATQAALEEKKKAKASLQQNAPEAPKKGGAPSPSAPKTPEKPFSAPPKPEAGWNMDAFAVPAGEEKAPKGNQPTEAPADPIPPAANPVGQDFFADVSLEKPIPLAPLPKAEGEGDDNGDVPPPALPGGNPFGGNNAGGTPPELPNTPTNGMTSPPRTPIGGTFKVVVIASVVLLAGVAYLIFSGGSGKDNKLNQTYVSLNQAPSAEDELLPPPAGMSAPAPQAKPTDVLAEEGAAEGSQIEIDFVNEAGAEGENVISAQGDEEMPEELGALAKFQRAVMREKAKKEGSQEESLEELEDAMEEAQDIDDEFLAATPTSSEIKDQLAEYRKALAEASTPEELPKPNEFMNEYAQEHAGGRRQLTEADLAELSGTTQDDMLAPPVLENPYNLPVIPQPEAEAMAPAVRTLEDFDMAAFEPEEKRVRIPKGVRPRLSAAQFPNVEVLSFVPERGIIATNRGREGVLLIGESIEGWELVDVAQDYAEFNNGTRKYTLVRRN